MGSTTPVPYWQTNIATQVPTCPPFLLNLSAKDISILSTPDSAYTTLSWPSVRHLIATNRIDLFQRQPLQLRRYLQFSYQIKQKWGSIIKFILNERVKWTVPVVAKGKKPFECDEDVKILWNDWPYGIDERIVHLVVWTKFELVDDPETGDLTTEARREVDEFVNEVFGKTCGEENVIWFKNWAKLKSVSALEHFHVMLFDPDPAFVEKITNGDVPLSRRVVNQEVKA
ncbi:hypothetical protein GLAREA_04814 [Glarea lozoyensis ATCC 20868]|uniref:N-acetylglucosamine-induced protein 1 n=1 Tax=Glarea lozoyensis (strain ATCC 20868 / MF5171) TaxID=1116229 RepID=S3DNG6_GLAL2|nr:uncharacterized protein GLAREA_04814 [Glarea lozoyensis ATCC 20868]EPE28023.1 hypothetical protein GLAREA_04814 [Glarea lozoyensis ATCC 20868]